MEDVHRLLHAAREALELSQAQLAEATGVSTRTLHRLENQIGVVRFEVLDELRKFYGQQGLELVAAESGHRWSLRFSRKLAPYPTQESVGKLYDPIPGMVLKAARILTGMTQSELAELAKMAHTTVRRLEKRDPDVSPEKAYLLQTTLEASGVHFQKPKDGMGWTLSF